MKYQAVIDLIKTKGFWRINFEPLTYADKKLTLSQCKELVDKNAIHLRGWDYPHVPQRHGDDTASEPGDIYWQGWLNWEGENHKEFWRMYQSSQFIHYLGLREDWLNDFQIRSVWEQANRTYSPGQALGVVATTYQITEIFEFLSRLIVDGLYEDGVKVSISLNNTEGRELIVDQFTRVGFSSPKKTSAPTISFSNQYMKEEIESGARDKALEVIIHFFERFGWTPPNIEVIKADQEKFLGGKA